MTWCGTILGPGDHRRSVRAKEAFLREKHAALDELMKHLGELVEFYPQHIDKEDKHFFIPCMAYFSDTEKAEMLARHGRIRSDTDPREIPWGGGSMDRGEDVKACH